MDISIGFEVQFTNDLSFINLNDSFEKAQTYSLDIKRNYPPWVTINEHVKVNVDATDGERFKTFLNSLKRQQKTTYDLKYTSPYYETNKVMRIPNSLLKQNKYFNDMEYMITYTEEVAVEIENLWNYMKMKTRMAIQEIKSSLAEYTQIYQITSRKVPYKRILYNPQKNIMILQNEELNNTLFRIQCTIGLPVVQACELMLYLYSLFGEKERQFETARQYAEIFPEYYDYMFLFSYSFLTRSIRKSSFFFIRASFYKLFKLFLDRKDVIKIRKQIEEQLQDNDIFLDYFDTIHTFELSPLTDQKMQFLTQSTYFEVDAENPIILIEIRFFHALLCKEHGSLDCDLTIDILKQLQNRVREVQQHKDELPRRDNIIVRSSVGKPLVTITANPLQKISQVRKKINQKLVSLGMPQYDKQMHIRGKSTRKKGQDELDKLADYTLQMDNSITIDYSTPDNLVDSLIRGQIAFQDFVKLQPLEEIPKPLLIKIIQQQEQAKDTKQALFGMSTQQLVKMIQRIYQQKKRQQTIPPQWSW
jgi:hypothetical protein